MKTLIGILVVMLSLTACVRKLPNPQRTLIGTPTTIKADSSGWNQQAIQGDKELWLQNNQDIISIKQDGYLVKVGANLLELHPPFDLYEDLRGIIGLLVVYAVDEQLCVIPCQIREDVLLISSKNGPIVRFRTLWRLSESPRISQLVVKQVLSRGPNWSESTIPLRDYGPLYLKNNRGEEIRLSRENRLLFVGGDLKLHDPFTSVREKGSIVPLYILDIDRCRPCPAILSGIEISLKDLSDQEVIVVHFDNLRWRPGR